MSGRISPRQFSEADGVEDWRVLGEGACAYFRTGSYVAGARLVHAIGELTGLGEHHPDLDLRHEGVTVRLITAADDWFGLTERDLDLARQISAVARELGLSADPPALQTVQVSVDALVSSEVMPFWRAVLGYEYGADSPEEDLIDPRGRGPSFWFQEMDAPRPQRNRIHIFGPPPAGGRARRWTPGGGGRKLGGSTDERSRDGRSGHAHRAGGSGPFLAAGPGQRPAGGVRGADPSGPPAGRGDP
jgi:4a-hydroxytetrahydrobiopterin dehydratase